MEFIKQLKETEQSKEARKHFEDIGLDIATRIRHFEWIPINDRINLSIQASEHSYCYPRKTLPAKQYENMELAIIYNDDIVHANNVITDELLLKKLNYYYDGTVYGYVPIEVLEHLYLYLMNEKNN